MSDLSKFTQLGFVKHKMKTPDLYFNEKRFSRILAPTGAFSRLLAPSCAHSLAKTFTFASQWLFLMGTSFVWFWLAPGIPLKNWCSPIQPDFCSRWELCVFAILPCRRFREHLSLNFEFSRTLARCCIIWSPLWL